MTEVVIQERRALPRKPLQRRATITLMDNTVLHGQAVDLTMGGIRVNVERAVTVPQECTVEFSIMLDGRPHPVTGSGRILSCVCTGMAFSIGLQFVQLNEASKAAVGRYMGL